MISKLHYITQGDIENKTHAQLAEQACKGGVQWVQLRVKNATPEEWRQEALETLEVCRKYKAKLIINDNVALALEIGADGVHLGKGDMSLPDARTLVGKDMIIGATANTLEDIIEASQQGVDYMGLGPFRFTTTKDKLSPILGLEGYQKIIQQMNEKEIHLPIIAIGGILLDDVPELLAVGIHGVAIASGINQSIDPIQSALAFTQVLATTLND